MSEDLDARLRAAAEGVDARTLVDLGCDLADAGRHPDAEGCFRRAVALGEEWVSFNLGNELMAQGRLTEAVDAFNRAIVAGEPDAWLNLGHCYQDLGDVAEAMHAYREADAVNDPNGALALAYMLREQGEADEAEALARRAASLGNLEALGAAACWQYDRTLDPALEADLRRGAAHYPSARADLAHILRDTGRAEEARQELTLGAKLGQRECWLPLGNLLDDVFGDPAAAEDAYRAGIAAGDTYCHHNLGLLLLERGDRPGAEEQFRRGSQAGDRLAEHALRDLLNDEE
ncbi:MAG TPA: tetratricopeptide repeat protein [Oryzihumus sp.]|nr:tetratricopeptide repeat protein [Oryzihumus sp.]